MKIDLSYKAEDQLGELSIDLQYRIRDKIRFYMQQENIFTFAKYIAVDKEYRFRVGNYRLKFIIKDQVAEIVSIERRDKAYK